MGLLDQTIEELRQRIGGIQPTVLAAEGFSAAMAYLIVEIQTAAGPDTDFCQQVIDADVPSKWKRAAIRITQLAIVKKNRGRLKSGKVDGFKSINATYKRSSPMKREAYRTVDVKQVSIESLVAE